MPTFVHLIEFIQVASKSKSCGYIPLFWRYITAQRALPVSDAPPGTNEYPNLDIVGRCLSVCMRVDRVSTHHSLRVNPTH